MNYKKKYKEALERAKYALTTDMDNSGHWAVNYIFPELKESEDEKIRKGLINGFKECLEDCSYPKNAVKYWHDIDVNQILAWLEKQAEQKPTDKVEQKFKVGDWIADKSEYPYKVKSVYWIDGGYYIATNLDGEDCRICFGAANEYFHLWTINDAKDGDVLFSDLMDGKTFIYNGIDPYTAIRYSFIISNDGKDVLPYHIGKPNTGIGTIDDNRNIIHPATKEQRDLLFSKLKEAGYEWDNGNKELKKIEPKFKIGDWVTDGVSTYQVYDISDNEYWLSAGEIAGKVDISDYHLWTIQDAKEGDVLVNGSNIFIFHFLNDTRLMGYCHVNIDDGRFYDDLGKNECFCLIDAVVTPATKEQRELLFEKIKETGHEWDTNKKELRKMEVANKESEDERIRKQILNYFVAQKVNEPQPVLDSWIAWLEKQGEKPQGKTALEAIKEEKVDNQNCVKSDDKVEPKFKVGDWIANGGAHPCYVKSIFGDYYELCSCEGVEYTKPIIDVDYVYLLWTFQEARDGDILSFETDDCEWILIYKKIIPPISSIVPHDSLRYHVLLSGDVLHDSGICAIVSDDYDHYIHPATKEQCDMLFNKLREEGAVWDSEKKQLKYIEL